jgi:alpha-ketoglutaric semialdehyde dehydrogenase
VTTVAMTGGLPPVMAATGFSLVAGEERAGEGEVYRAVDPTTGREIGPGFRNAAAGDVDDAVDGAARAFEGAEVDPRVSCRLLEATTQLLGEHGATVVATASLETGLGTARLEGELTRTISQLRFLAEITARGERLGATIDNAAGALPMLARVNYPVGPVGVFGASNFPLAFSVPGGDSAAALAAGCPVVAKAHEAHPSTSEICGRIITEAVRRCDLDPGWFSLLHGRGHFVGEVLVSAPGIRAVAFTGSRTGGRALFDLAARRPDPVPVYAEMGSTNPVFVTEGAFAARGEAIAGSLGESVAGSAGQLCTKPGLVFVESVHDADRFARLLSEAASSRGAQPMLTLPINVAFHAQLRARRAVAGIELISRPDELAPDAVAGAPGGGLLVSAAVLLTTLEHWLANDALHEEHFGPAAIVVACRTGSLIEASRAVGGSLTATVHLEPGEHARLRPLLGELTRRAGRVLVGGVPTGVRVSRAMQHGGPYPATTSARDTSVGAGAVDRFLRPVAFQDFPDDLLPPALRAGNPLGIERRVDGSLTTAPHPA